MRLQKFTPSFFKRIQSTLLFFLVITLGGYQFTVAQSLSDIEPKAYPSEETIQKNLAALNKHKDEQARVSSIYDLLYGKESESLNNAQILEIQKGAIQDTNLVIRLLAIEHIAGKGRKASQIDKKAYPELNPLLIHVFQDLETYATQGPFTLGGTQKTSTNPEALRTKAAETLGITGGTKITELMIKELKNPRFMNAALISLKELSKQDSLTKMMKSEVFPVVFGLMENGAAFYVNPIVQTLRNIDEERAFEAITGLLKSKNVKARINAVTALGYFSSDNEARDALLTSLTDTDNQVLENALFSLSKGRFNKNENFENKILPLLESTNPTVRGNAVYALGNTKSPTSIQKSAHLLKDEDPLVRTKAVQALAGAGDPALLDEFILLLDDEDRSVRFQTLTALSILNNPKAIEGIEKMIQKHPETEEVATRVLNQLRK